MINFIEVYFADRNVSALINIKHIVSISENKDGSAEIYLSDGRICRPSQPYEAFYDGYSDVIESWECEYNLKDDGEWVHRVSQQPALLPRDEQCV